MSSRTARIVAALTAAGLAALTTATAGAAAPRPTTTVASEAAAGWLAQQFSDHFVYAGSTSFDGGTTADSVFALAAAKAGAAKIDSAMAYFAKHVEKYVDIKNADGYGPNDGGIAKTAIAAMVTGADPTHFGGYDLLQQLKSDECPAGSTKCTPGAAANIYSSVSESLAVLAEARGAKTYGARYAPDAAALKYFLSLQCANGGFTSKPTGGPHCTADPDSTGYAVMALQADGSKPTALARAAHWLRSTRNGDGSWSAQGVHNVDSTGLAAAALAGQGSDTSRSMRWLASQQVTTGPTVGAGASRGALKYHGAFDAAASVKATADGLLGMVAHGNLATLTDRGASADTAVLALSPARVAHAQLPAGTTQTVTGAGFAAHETVVATLAAHRIGSATANKSGTVTLSFPVPVAAHGTRALTLTGRTSALTATATMRVGSAAAPAPGSAALANTGRDGHTTELEVLLAVVLIGGGAGFLLLGRRRTGSR